MILKFNRFFVVVVVAHVCLVPGFIGLPLGNDEILVDSFLKNSYFSNLPRPKQSHLERSPCAFMK